MGAEPYASPEEEQRARLEGARRNVEKWAADTVGFVMPAGYTSLSGAFRVQRQSFDLDGNDTVSKPETQIIKADES